MSVGFYGSATVPAQLTGHKRLYYGCPPGAGGMVWVPQPCDTLVLPISILPPAVPAIIQRLRSDPKIEWLEIFQGLSGIFKRSYPMFIHLMTGLCVRRNVPPRAHLQDSILQPAILQSCFQLTMNPAVTTTMQR